MAVRILITGAGGFLGSKIAAAAVKEGALVAAIVRNGKSARVPPGVLSIPCTIESPDWQAIGDFRPEICIHCAWISTPGVYSQSPLNASLASASIALADGLAERGLGRFVGLGSCLEYAPSSAPLVESDAEETIPTPYSASKLAVLRHLEKIHPRRFAWLRVFYAFGNGEHPGRFLTCAVRALKAGKNVHVRRPLDVVDYVHADDIAAAALAVARVDQCGIFNAGFGLGRTVWEAAMALAALAGCPELLSREAGQEMVARVADNRKLRGTGWVPRRNFEEGLSEIVAKA